MEGVAACAIALRTKAYEASRAGKTPYWDIKAEPWGYQGSSEILRTASFQDAIRASQDMILKPSENKSTSNGIAVGWFVPHTQSTPLAEINALANEGKNAKEILEHFFSGAKISLLNVQ
jgi:hypothetical protein